MNLLRLSIHTFLILELCTIFIPSSFAFHKPGETDTVKIGLLISDKNSLTAMNGAELAIRKANENGGFKGDPFHLIVRSMEGLWGTGSKEAVNLIFNEKVWAILGSHDGRNAHLVEQVAAKTHIVFLSAWSGDPTLSQAFVPWFFSCVPNYFQQATALIEDIYDRKKFIRIAICSDSSYDSKMAVKSLIKKIKSEGKKEPLQFYYDNSSQIFSDLTDKIKKTAVDCIILCGHPSASVRLISQLKSERTEPAIYGSLTILDENKISDNDILQYQNVVFISSGNWLSPEAVDFREEYKKAYGNLPGEVAAYSYDGTNLIIEAVRKAGPDREKIQKSLREINYIGVTGSIQFDDKGNRKGQIGLMRIINGNRVPAER
jgi:branched-chain amino acid transport system substrate-binding protein